MQKKTYLLLPENLDLQQLLKEHPPKISLKIDFLRYVITVLILRNKHLVYKYDRKTKSMFCEYQYCPLYSPRLKNVQRDYNAHMKWLLDRGIVDKLPYSEGVSFSYRLCSKYQMQRLKFSVVTNATMAFRINQQLTPKFKYPYKFRYLGRHLSDNRIIANLPAAIDDFDSNELYLRDYPNYVSTLCALLQINNGYLRFSYSHDSDGRIHTNFTQLPKIGRPYLTYDNKRLGEVDLSNSVPYFLSCYLNSTIGIGNNIEVCEFTSVIHTMLNKSLVPLDTIELQLFHDLVCSGQLYESFFPDFMSLDEEELQNLCTYHLDDTLDGSLEQLRKIVKNVLVAMLFGRNGDFKRMEFFFGKKFPSILHWVQIFKTRKYKKLSHFLFQFEAHFMLEELAQGFCVYKSHRVPVFSLHDCIITTEEHLDELKEYMQQRLHIIFGRSAGMKKTLWSKESFPVKMNKHYTALAS